KKPVRHHAIIIHQRDNRFALRKRRERFLHALWGFDQQEPKHCGEFLDHITQNYSHFTLEADLYLSQERFEDEEFEWFKIDEIKRLSLSSADHKAVALLRYNNKK
ncbi:MAG: NUDIX domain-containing protein, partial [Epsilonproteobacteria bacterium]|nr:NUDIX domain-containing protein [Campylobacterota bacterium]